MKNIIICSLCHESKPNYSKFLYCKSCYNKTFFGKDYQKEYRELI